MLTVISPPTIEPITVTELGSHLRVDPADVMLEPYLIAVRQHLERIGGFAFCTQTLEWTLDEFPSVWSMNSWGAIVLPRPPLQSVTSVKYIDVNGTEQTMSSSLYTADTRSYPGSVLLNYGESWPSPRSVPHAVRVTYVAGYASPELVPEDLKQIIRIAAGNLYEFREEIFQGLNVSVSNSGLLTRLLAQHRVWVT